MNRVNNILLLILILILAAVLRYYVLSNTNIPVADSGEYLEIAANLTNGTGYQLSTWWTYYYGDTITQPLHPDASRQPLYPFILSIFFRLFYPSFKIAQVLSLVFGVLNICILYFIGIKLFKPGTSLLACLLTAFNSAHIWFSTQAYAETLFTFIFYLIILMFLIRPASSHRKCVTIGFLMGLLYLTRLNGVFILFTGIFSLFLIKKEQILSKKKSVLIVLSASLIVASPWFIRNTITFQNPLKTGGAYMNWVDSFQEMYCYWEYEI